MQPNPAIPANWWIPLLAILIFFLLISVRRRREAIRHRVRNLIIVESVFLGIAYFMAHSGHTALESLLAGFLAAAVVNQLMPARSRYIPASVRRRKIAEHELRTGKKFNPRKHELDHEVAFSKGGSHTEDNLRVVDKRKNRSKGATSPWWDLLGK